MSILERCLYWRDVCIREISGVCISTGVNEVFVLEKGVHIGVYILKCHLYLKDFFIIEKRPN